MLMRYLQACLTDHEAGKCLVVVLPDLSRSPVQELGFDCAVPNLKLITDRCIRLLLTETGPPWYRPAVALLCLRLVDYGQLSVCLHSRDECCYELFPENGLDKRKPIWRVFVGLELRMDIDRVPVRASFLENGLSMRQTTGNIGL